MRRDTETRRPFTLESRSRSTWRTWDFRQLVGKGAGHSQSRLSETIRGRRGISADTAPRLAAWLGTSRYWMNLQRNYELNVAVRDHGDVIAKIAKRYAGAVSTNEQLPEQPLSQAPCSAPSQTRTPEE